jgi:transcriptional regulator with GAF, ATPase, and Fis domain
VESVPRLINARALAGSNRRLEEEVAAGRYRSDLFYGASKLFPGICSEGFFQSEHF